MGADIKKGVTVTPPTTLIHLVLRLEKPSQIWKEKRIEILFVIIIQPTPKKNLRCGKYDRKKTLD